MARVLEALLVTLALITGVLSTETNWTINLPDLVTAQNGLCALLPCNYTLSETLSPIQLQAAWYKDYQQSTQVMLYHSDQNSIHPDYTARSQLIGNLSQLQCSLLLNNISNADNGTYQFIIKLLDLNQTYESKPLTLITSDFELKPNISTPHPIVENQQSVLICFFFHPCPGTGPILNWVNISVLKNSSEVNQTESNNSSELSTVFLHFLPRAEDHNTTVSCRAHYPGSSTQSSQSFLLDVQYGPKIEKMNSITVNLFETVQVKCVADSNPLANISWFRNNRSILSAINQSLTLEIHNISHLDKGPYICKAWTAHNKARKRVIITVNYGPLIAPMERSVVVLEGYSQTLLCIVDSYPLSNITWSEGGTILSSNLSESLNLNLTAMKDTDSRTYTCSAQNSFGKANRSVDVRLEYAPRSLSIVRLHNSTVNSSIETCEGNSLSLYCSVESRPPSNLTWKLAGNVWNHSVASNSLWLHLDNITYREDGVHECVAENPHGTTRRSVKVSLTYSPKETAVRVSGSRHGVREGDNVTLSCFCRSNPPATNYSWFRVGVDKETEFVTSGKSLPLETVTRDQDDVGYYCRAENTRGASNSSLWQINVEYLPEFSEDSRCFQQLERMICVCVARANPPGDLTWHLPKTNLSGNESNGRFVSQLVRHGHLVTGSLIMLGPQDEEDVTATCLVRNPHGEATFKVYLWIKGMDSQLEQLVLGVLAGALGMLILSLLMCQIFICCRRREKQSPIDATEMQMLTGQRTPVRALSLVEAEGEAEAEAEMEAETVEVDSQTEEVDFQMEEAQQTTSLTVLENGEASQEAGEEELELHYACIDFSRANCSDGIVGKRDSTQYAQIKPQ